MCCDNASVHRSATLNPLKGATLIILLQSPSGKPGSWHSRGCNLKHSPMTLVPPHHNCSGTERVDLAPKNSPDPNLIERQGDMPDKRIHGGPIANQTRFLPRPLGGVPAVSSTVGCWRLILWAPVGGDVGPSRCSVRPPPTPG